MPKDPHFSVGEFAKLLRTTPATLRHYEKLGLLCPLLRGENHYRYYSSGQFGEVILIHALQATGMSLSDIKDLMSRRNPDRVIAEFTRQQNKINEQIEKWTEGRKLLITLQQSIESALSANENEITVEHLEAAPIIFGNPNDYKSDKNDFDFLVDFYRDMYTAYPDLNFSYPVWGMFEKDRILRRDHKTPSRYYFYNPDGKDERPAGLYAIGWMRASYGQCGALYERMISFIDCAGLEICGNAYEEYPLNEVCIADSNNHLARVLIAVSKKPE